MSLALIGLSSIEALPERPSQVQEEEDADFAAMMRLLLIAPSSPVQHTAMESVTTPPMGREVGTISLVGESADKVLPTPSPPKNRHSLLQTNAIAAPLTSQFVTTLPDSNQAKPVIDPAEKIVVHAMTSAEGGVVPFVPDISSAVDFPVEQSQTSLSRPSDAEPQNLSSLTSPMSSSPDVKRFDTTSPGNFIHVIEGNGTISIDNVPTETAFENATTVSTRELSPSGSEADPAMNLIVSRSATDLASRSRSIDPADNPSTRIQVGDSGATDSSGLAPVDLDRFPEQRRSEVTSESDWKNSESLTRLSESTTSLQTDPSVSAVSGGPSAFYLAESITVEIQQPLSTQVSRAVLNFLERPVAHDADSLTLRLDPPELGEMVIEVSRTGEGLAIRVSAREAVTMEMLFSRGHEIESHLRGRDVDLKSLEFLPSGSLGGQTSSEQHRRSVLSQLDSVTSTRRSSRHVSVTGTLQGQAESPGLGSPHGLNFRA